MTEAFFTREKVDELLQTWSGGRGQATDELMLLVYDELRRQAHRYLRRERANHTLETTALVHEAYLRLISQDRITWQSPSHFLAIAAQMMRWILVDYAKNRRRVKREGHYKRVPFDFLLDVADGGCEVDLLGLDEALTRLERLDVQQARIVELRYFSGLSVAETAEVIGVSESTVKRDWNMARAWLRRELV